MQPVTSTRGPVQAGETMLLALAATTRSGLPVILMKLKSMLLVILVLLMSMPLVILVPLVPLKGMPRPTQVQPVT